MFYFRICYMITMQYELLGIQNQIFIQILINAKNPIHRIASQVLIFQTGSFIFMLLDIYFLGQAYIIVYVGAIAIQFQFVIMLIEHPSVGYNYEINNMIRDHNSILTYNINKISTLSVKIGNEFSIEHNITQITHPMMSDTQHIKDIMFSYMVCNKNIQKDHNLHNIKNNMNISFIPNIDSIFRIVSYIAIFLICIYVSFIIYNIDILFNIIQDIDGSQMYNTNYYSYEINNFYYTIWSTEYKIITYIEIQGKIIYLGYPIALINISIALWAVLIGIISICSPRILYIFSFV